MQLRDLENGAATAAATAAKKEEAYPLFQQQEGDEEYNIHSSSLLPSSPRTRRYKTKYHECIILFLLITVIALITALVPVSQSRITITIEKSGAVTANDADDNNNDEVISMNNKAAQDDPSMIATMSATNSSSNTHLYVDYHTNHFDYSSTWCPNANCKGTTLCYPCQRRWLIIVTVGRTASTTLTKMMDLLPGVRMTGENSNLVGRFENLLRASPQEMLNGTGDAWFHNPIPEESWSCASQTLFTTANPPKLLENDKEDELLLESSDETTILGFKTIRLFDDDVLKNGYHLTQQQVQEIAQDKVEILNHLFPCARYIVNARSDMNSQVSAWQKQFGATNTIQTTQRLQADDDLLEMFHQIMGVSKRSYWLDSTQWTSNITVLNEMVDWLGFSTQCHFQAALEYNTKDGYEATKTEADCSLSPDCTYLY